MKKLEPIIYENGIGRYLNGDCQPLEEARPVGKWGSMYLSYLEQTDTLRLNELMQTGRIASILADINEECRNRYQAIVRQMAEAEGVTEDLKRRDQMGWVRAMNSIANRAEEIVRAELIYA